MIDLRFDNVSKRYRIRQEDATHHAGWINKMRSRLGPGKDFWALRDVSFEVRHGETLGIIGHNGSGKSTALKLMASITTPTRGEITIRGRIAALLEVASGFHSGIDRPGKCLFARIDYRHAAPRDPRQARPHHRLRGSLPLHRSAGETLFLGHVCEAGIPHRCASGARDPSAGRSTGGGRHDVSEKVASGSASWNSAAAE